ncbi:hypothetical protein T265_09587 [Opisthorchis viverrini]|uniref:Uncharacterized protein n=1 Tax=Opisthorchis viverrini TaxID=6198 RepID=A0A074Z5E8_OPIVI|nr:hypothetical protein T265_09587 [Opisthorchis viverrini]KER22303.1 hypothetical protein T265_09587 [Opisthorchis viverrini]
MSPKKGETGVSIDLMSSTEVIKPTEDRLRWGPFTEKKRFIMFRQNSDSFSTSFLGVLKEFNTKLSLKVTRLIRSSPGLGFLYPVPPGLGFLYPVHPGHACRVGDRGLISPTRD